MGFNSTQISNYCNWVSFCGLDDYEKYQGRCLAAALAAPTAGHQAPLFQNTAGYFSAYDTWVTFQCASLCSRLSLNGRCTACILVCRHSHALMRLCWCCCCFTGGLLCNLNAKWGGVGKVPSNPYVAICGNPLNPTAAITSCPEADNLNSAEVGGGSRTCLAW